jgi:O-glycosyl hydrolase
MDSINGRTIGVPDRKRFGSIEIGEKPRPRRKSIASALLIGAGLFSHPSRGATIVVDPSVKYQKFEGFGTSLCWWSELAGGWSAANRNKLIGAIVDPDTGLGYGCFRYNIGGGDQPGHTHLVGERAVPGFKPTEAGDYDWTADPNQRNILLGIAARDSGAIFEAFSNSPPWWMTISGCSSGNTNGEDNLKPAYFTNFAGYLADVVAHYKTAWGITFRTVEPFNEPSAGWWKALGSQEGCGFASQQSKMVVELGKQLVAKGLFPATEVSASDENSIATAVSSAKAYDDSALSFMSQINSHSYAGLSSRTTLDSIALARGKNLWQSESGPLNKGSDTSDITMWMSNVIIQDLRDMKPDAWIDWQVSDPSANWCTIQTTQSSQSFKYTGRYYMHAAFSRFIRPGSQIISSSDPNSVAALVPSNGNLVVVLRNAASASASYTVDLSKFGSIGSAATVYRFSLPGSLVKQADIAIANKQFAFTAPAQTLTTLVIPGGTTSLHGSGVRGASGTTGLRFRQIAHEEIAIDLVSRSPCDVEVFDGRGTRVALLRKSGGSSSETVDLRPLGLKSGVYSVEVRQDGHTISGNIAITR